MSSSDLRCFLFICLISAAVSKPEEMKAKPEQDVTLRCPTVSDGDIVLLLWKRPDLKDDVYVFFYRNERSYDEYQHPAYRGRVQPRRPEVLDGHVDVVLKNVSVNDTGTYECRVVISNTGRNGTTHSENIHRINLMVADSGHTAGNVPGNLGPEVPLLVVGLLLILVIVCAGGVIFLRKRGLKNDRPYEPPPDASVPMSLESAHS